MKFRKKPVVIEAFTIESGEVPLWFIDGMNNGTIEVLPNALGCDITTLEGVMHANVDDYIIQGVNGEIYPCKPDIFEKTYELAE